MRSYRFKISLAVRVLLAAMVVLPLIFAFAVPASAARGKGGKGKATGMVYTTTNAAAGNEVVIYTRSANGALAFQQAVATGGLGTGSGLGSQGAVILSPNGRMLFTVDAGSDEITAFAVVPGGLKLLDRVASGGDMPISLTLHGKYLYALNAGAPGNISGFMVGKSGDLTAIPGSTQPLSNGGAGDSPAPAQVAFSPDGRTLVVTEKGTNLIVTYAVHNGVAGAPMAYPSAGMTPFGFEFNKRGVLVVSEAFGGAPNISAVSSYNLHGQEPSVASPSVSAGQTAACWIAISKNSRYAYAANTGSSNISSYSIGKDGSLTLIEAVAGYTGDGSAPADLAFSKNGRYLYALSGGSNTISAFAWQPDGGLTELGTVSTPAGSVGLAAQ